MAKQHLRLALLGATLLTGLPYTFADAATPQRYDVAALGARAEILVDRWGIAHIRAASAADAFFAQGFNAARDRLWQIDLWRRRGLGQLAEVLGPTYVEQDRAARLFLYRGPMDGEWAAYGPEAKSATEAFAAGINAYVAATERDPALLPPEFAMLSYKPALWSAADVVRIRSNGLARNLPSEVARARVACAGNLEADRLRVELSPVALTVPDGLDPCSVPSDVLATYNLGTRPVAFAPARRADLARPVSDESDLQEGSNHWVVAPSRSATGRAIFASDPHRAHALPSLRYIVHLSAPGLNVIGAGEPALPGVSMGHNDQIAFGLTIFPADQEDLYVYETDPADPTRYRYAGGWESMRTERETVAVQGGESRPVELQFTRHGPVIHRDDAKHLAYAVRSVWDLPGTAPYAASLGFLRAADWNEFQAGLQRWGTPSLNQLYADRAGNIGWKPAGAMPVRPNWTGLLPVPGDGRYEWNGLHAPDVLPQRYNPPDGWLATANHYDLPAFYPNEQVKLGFEWAPPYRFTRIEQALSGTGKLTIAQMQKLQSDHLSLMAVRTVALLPADAGSAAARMLRGWNGELAPGSAAAALYGVWYYHHLRPALVQQLAPSGMAPLLSPGDPTALLVAMENPDRFGTDGAAVRNALLLRTLEAAYAETRSKLGDDARKWRWGDLHQALFEHPLAKLQPGGAKLNVGPLPVGGDANTIDATMLRTEDFRLTGSASFRMVLDVGNWDASSTVNTPGQSGDPRSRHYGDLAPIWAKGQFVPMLFSKAAIDKAVEQKIVLMPAR